MKKVFTLLLITLAAFTFKSGAQTTTCNAGFDFTISGLSVNFTPAITTVSTANHNYWIFGDGSVSSDISPVHVYASGGVYTVTHIFYRSENGAAVCVDSVKKIIQFPTPNTTCNLHALFSIERDPATPGKIYFHNLSTSANDIKIVRWAFGDGSYSYDFNASHTYTTSGLYTVCLTILNSTNTATACIRDTCIQLQVQIPAPTPCNLTAYFAFHADSLQSNQIHFLNYSTPFENSDSIRWSFGDGTYSNDLNPTHTYTAAGTYNVCIRVQKKTIAGSTPCVKEFCKQVVVANECKLKASFSFERDPVQTNIIKFTNLSTSANDIKIVKWAFGDGSYSYDFNATHTYTTSGLYTVCLTILNSTNTATACVRDTCVQLQVQMPAPTPCNLTAYFAFHADTLQSNKIHFLNYSTPFENSDSIRWSFGDGTYSNDLNPTHTYTATGTYNVCIRVQKKTTAGSALCVKEYCKQVVVTIVNECRLEANFTFEKDTINKNKVYFKNLSTPATSVTNVMWSFGDGSFSTSLNPDHTYAHTGIYNVCLKITSGANCYKYVCKTIEIKEPEINCNDISKFTFVRSTVNCLEFKFTPVVQNPNWKYVWSFGDGTGSNQMIPAGHVYPRSGNYTVYLTVYRSSNCVSTYHLVAETGACFSCSNIWVKFEYKRESSTSNKIYFHALSNYPILSQSWTITKLSISGAASVTLTQLNPDFTFKESGDYRVCIRAITAGQCVKEYCEVIHVELPNTACTLTAYPNPAYNQVSVSLQLTSPDMIHVYIYNSLNILVKQKEQQGIIGNNLVTTSTEGLVPGWYTIRVVYGNRVCYSRFQKL